MRRREKVTVTVAGVPVTVTLAGRELAILVGRFDPQAAPRRLRVDPWSGTAAVAVRVAGPREPGGSADLWLAALYPAAPGAAGREPVPGGGTPGRQREPNRSAASGRAAPDAARIGRALPPRARSRRRADAAPGPARAPAPGGNDRPSRRPAPKENQRSRHAKENKTDETRVPRRKPDGRRGAVDRPPARRLDARGQRLARPGRPRLRQRSGNAVHRRRRRPAHPARRPQGRSFCA